MTHSPPGKIICVLEEDLRQVLAQERFAADESDVVAMGKVLFSTEACLALP
jgi:hypothetical protein